MLSNTERATGAIEEWGDNVSFCTSCGTKYKYKYFSQKKAKIVVYLRDYHCGPIYGISCRQYSSKENFLSHVEALATDMLQCLIIIRDTFACDRYCKNILSYTAKNVQPVLA